jgi:predicted deacetylase
MSDAALCVVLHDVATSTRPACERLLRAIGDVAELPLTLLAVPRFHHEQPSSDFEAWLGERQRRGDELALHGFTHLDEGTPDGWLDRLRRRHYTRGEAEFWALSKADAAERLALGRDWFARNGWRLHGFVAPAWLLGPGAWAALAESSFAYTSTLRHIHALASGRRLTSQSLVYSSSSAWRRGASVVWNRAVAARQRHHPLLRIELHPRDADFAPIRRSWQRLLETQLARRQALTVAEIVRGVDAAPAVLRESGS